MLQISHHTTGAVMWKEIKTLHEGKSALVKVDIRKHMLLACCDEGRDVKVHFGALIGYAKSWRVWAQYLMMKTMRQ
jgi:hypothetical protein